MNRFSSGNDQLVTESSNLRSEIRFVGLITRTSPGSGNEGTFSLGVLHSSLGITFSNRGELCEGDRYNTLQSVENF